MAENEKDLLTYAYKIRRYCKKQDCDDCVFKLKSGIVAGLCAFEFMPPQEWHLPKPRHRYNDTDKAIHVECAKALRELHEENAG